MLNQFELTLFITLLTPFISIACCVYNFLALKYHSDSQKCDINAVLYHQKALLHVPYVVLIQYHTVRLISEVSYQCIYNSNTRTFWCSDCPWGLKIILGDDIQKYITLGPTALLWYIFGYHHLGWFSNPSGYLSIKMFSYSRCIYIHINLDFVSVDMKKISHSDLRSSYDIFDITLLDQSYRVI